MLRRLFIPIGKAKQVLFGERTSEQLQPCRQIAMRIAHRNGDPRAGIAQRTGWHSADDGAYQS